MGQSNRHLLLISNKIWQLETLQFTRQKTHFVAGVRSCIGKTGKKQKGTRRHHDMGVLPA